MGWLFATGPRWFLYCPVFAKRREHLARNRSARNAARNTDGSAGTGSGDPKSVLWAPIGRGQHSSRNQGHPVGGRAVEAESCRIQESRGGARAGFRGNPYRAKYRSAIEELGLTGHHE